MKPREQALERVHSAWHEAMLTGDFESAWRQTDRLELPRREREGRGEFTWEPSYLLWNGVSFSGKHVLVRCNHGLGDTLQFARFLPQLSALARSVTVMAQPPLVRLLRTIPASSNVVNGWTEGPPAYDVEIEVMELAYAFRSTPETLPHDVPYFPPALVKAISADIPMPVLASALRVSLVWAASEWDISRSIELQAFASLGSIPHVDFFSLQQGAHAEAPAPSGLDLRRLSHRTREIENAAAAMLELDLVVTVDSMVAHLAGALGRPVWLLLQHAADWRWMRGRSESPWYPTLRIFRQPRNGDWRAVIEAVAAELRRVASS